MAERKFLDLQGLSNFLEMLKSLFATQNSLNSKLDKDIELTSENLDDIKSYGYYYGEASNTCINKPNNVDSFGLEVFKTSNGCIAQIFTEGNTTINCRYIRHFSDGWSSWIPLAEFSETPIDGEVIIADGTKGKIKTSKNISLDCIYLTDTITGYKYNVTIENGVLSSYIPLISFEITNPPDKMDYSDTNIFDPTGMVVTATYGNNTTKEITDYTYPEYINLDTTSIDITYVEHGVTYTDTLTGIIPPTMESLLQDFVYTINTDGTYNITDWKGTLHGVSSTEVVVPASNLINI